MTDPAVKLPQGTLIGGRYRVEEPLGQGGYGAVFRATQLNLDRPVAIKLLLGEAHGEDATERFRREAETLQQLEHPNIVRLLDFGVGEGGAPYLVFELLLGQTLDQLIRAEGPLPASRVARVAEQVLKALMEAHARGFVHRDIKPANIFLSNFQGEPDFVKVLDFGIAKGAHTRALTGQGMVVGTLPYMSPEQLGAPGEIGSATDLFALGLTMAEALTGEPVYKDVLLPQLIESHRGPDPVLFPPVVLASPLAQVIQRACQKHPELRHANAKEMLNHLMAASGQPIAPTFVPVPSASGAELADTGPAAVVGPSAEAAPKRPPPRRWRGLAALSLLLCAGGAVGGYLYVHRTDQPVRKPPPVTPPEPALEWLDFDRQGDLAEVNINADGVPDFIGLCAGGAPDTMSICAVDGATFKPLWRKPAGAASSRYYTRLGAGSRGVVYVDAGGVAHLLELGTGTERRTTRLGSRPESICAEASGKVWVVTTDQRAWALDPTARTVTAGTLPAACAARRFSFGCVTQRRCGVDFDAPTTTEIHLREVLVEGAHGLGVGGKANDASVPMLLGFTPGRASSPVRWRRPVAPGDGLTAAGSPSEVELRGGRAVVLYTDTSRARRLAAIDAGNGKTLWDVPTPPVHSFVLTASRVYVSRWARLDVRDAATGKLLGGVGKE
jgi:serine/threonine-protein kinase